MMIMCPVRLSYSAHAFVCCHSTEHALVLVDGPAACYTVPAGVERKGAGDVCSRAALSVAGQDRLRFPVDSSRRGDP